LHPLESAAFSRRTPRTAIRGSFMPATHSRIARRNCPPKSEAKQMIVIPRGGVHDLCRDNAAQSHDRSR
jgi:hypothetical protein